MRGPIAEAYLDGTLPRMVAVVANGVANVFRVYPRKLPDRDGVLEGEAGWRAAERELIENGWQGELP